MPEWITDLWRRLTHQYIRPGEYMLIYTTRNGEPFKGQYRVWSVGGWAVKIVEWRGETIRRDLIRKDANGNWFYRYEDYNG